MEEEGRSRLGEVKRVMVAIDESDRSLDALEWTLKFLGHSIANFEIVVFTAQPSSAFDYVSAFESCHYNYQLFISFIFLYVILES